MKQKFLEFSCFFYYKADVSNLISGSSAFSREHIKSIDYFAEAMVFPVVMNKSESWTIKKLSSEELMVFNCGVGEDC